MANSASQSSYVKLPTEDGVYDYYSALMLLQVMLTKDFPDLFTDQAQENSDQKEKIKNHIERFLRKNRITVDGYEDQTDRLVYDYYNELVAFSFLTDLVQDKAGVNEEINVNAWDDVEVRHTDGSAEKVRHFENPEHAQNVVRRLASVSKSLLDASMPMCEGNLQNNVRLVVLMNPIVDEDVGVSCSIRLLKPQAFTRQSFIDRGTVSEEEMSFLELAIRSGVSMCFVGATGSGKTTLMNYLLSTIPSSRRIVTIENNARELSLVKRDSGGKIVNNVVHTLTRPHENKKLDIDQEDLVAKALRFDPNVICVGEMRDSESYAAQEASLTGHTVVTSLHASGVRATHVRIAMLCQKKYPIDVHTALLQASMAFPLIIYISKLEDNSRKVLEIAECVISNDVDRSYHTLFAFDVEGKEEKDGAVHLIGKHSKKGIVSDDMRHTMMLNGATMDEIASLAKEEGKN